MAASLTWGRIEDELQEPLTLSCGASTVEPQRLELASPELLHRIAQGDPDALAELYDRASRVVFGLALRILRSEAEAEEATLDVFLHVWRKVEDFDPSRGTPTSWLLMLARSRAIDRLRRRNSRRHYEQQLEEIEETVAGEDSPEQTFMEQQMARRIREMLAQLPGEQRQAIEMAYFLGLSHRELAERLGQPLGTIKTRIRLGVLRLRQLMERGLCGRKARARLRSD